MKGHMTKFRGESTPLPAGRLEDRLSGSIGLMAAGPLKIVEFVAHDLTFQFASLNRVQGGTINPQRAQRGGCGYSDFASAFGA